LALEKPSHPLENPIHYKPTPKDIEEAAWIYIDRAFSEPATDSDDALDYIPTQILAERFKSDGYDGLAYKSKLTDDSFNIAFFDLDSARVQGAYLYWINKVTVTPDEFPVNQYWIREKMQVRNVIDSIRGLTEEEHQKLTGKETAEEQGEPKKGPKKG
jgi:hypothetical protein